MGKRELTDQEKELIDQTLKKRSAQKKEVQKRTKYRKVPFWAKLSNWSILVMIVPIWLTFNFYYSLRKIEAILGKGTIDYIAENGVSDGTRKVLVKSNMEWVLDFAKLYKYKELLIGGVFAVAVIIVALMWIADILIENRLQGKKKNESKRKRKK